MFRLIIMKTLFGRNAMQDENEQSSNKSALDILFRCYMAVSNGEKPVMSNPCPQVTLLDAQDTQESYSHGRPSLLIMRHGESWSELK